jgi:hypothetical protein
MGSESQAAVAGYTCCDNEELVLTVTFEAGAEIRNPFIEVSELTGGNV